MKRLYTVVFEVRWHAPHKRPYWSPDEETVRVLGNGDARPAIRRAERIVRKRIYDDTHLADGAVWHVGATKLVSVERGGEVSV